MTDMKGLLWRAMVVFAAALGAAGCGDEGIFSSVTSIDGQLVDPVDNAIFGVKVGVLYSYTLIGPQGAAAVTVPAATEIIAPYPNPLTSQGSVTIPLRVDGPTTARVEIRGIELGVTGPLALVFEGSVSADTALTWDGRDGFTQSLAPNAMYMVRVTSPLNPETVVADEPLIINRSASLMETVDAFNAVSGADGTYTLDDLAVGEEFMAKNAAGDYLGRGLLANSVTVVFRDPDYLPAERFVEIGPKETVELKTTLSPVIPSFKPAPDAE